MDQLLAAFSPYYTRSGPKPRINEADVLAFERLTGYSLPTEYREFVALFGGYALATHVVARTESAPSTDVGVEVFFGLINEDDPYDLRRNWIEDRRRLPDELLAIAIDGVGNRICLGVSGSPRSSVYVWDHERESEDSSGTNWNNVIPLASGFSKFLNSLRRV